MSVADLVEGIEEWKESYPHNALLMQLESPEKLREQTQRWLKAEQKIKTAIRELCNE